MGALCALSLAGCVDKDLYHGPEVKPAEEFFDFTTSSNCTVDLDYGLNYQVVFELYAENPVSEDAYGNLVRTKEEPVYRGATDKKGVFNDFISIPSYLTELYLYSDYLGTVSPIKLQIANNKVSFDQKAFIQSQRNTKSTRSITNNGYSYPDGFKILGDWTSIGCPTYLSSASTEIDAQLLYNIRKVFIEPGGGAAMEDIYPQYVDDNVNIEINITKPTEIGLVMLSSTAAKQNTVGYFTYPTNQKPTDVSQITPIIAFPRISSKICNSGTTVGGMYTGDRVDLKYWDGEKFVKEFPAGVSIAWFLIESSYNQNTSAILNNNCTFYSIRDLNRSKEHRTIALKNQSGQVVAFGMEDATNFTPTKNNTRRGNFGDAVFYLDFTDGNSVETGGIEELPEAPLGDIYTSFKGVLAFEDLWPSKGDYDMNDVVIEYKRDIYKNIITSKVVKIVDTFTPKYDGANNSNGFGYQLTGIPDSDISNISIESDGVASKYMEGKDREPGQEYPTFILFDNHKTALNQTFTVTMNVAREKYTEQAFTPFFNSPYWNQDYKYNMNPFIIISANTGRDKEAHIVKFPPTSKMNTSYFGKDTDASRPEEGLYYVNNENLPTGLQVSGVKVGTKRGADFLIPKEQKSILEAYPQFKTWASSFGTKELYWWKNPDNSKVITQ